MNILFICSRNQWRSPTGEQVWRKFFAQYPEVNLRSAGTSPRARRTVNVADIRWADFIFAMEDKHKQRLKAEFRQLLNYKPLAVLGIPDDYKYMDTELVEIFEAEAGAFLTEHGDELG